MAYYVNEVTGKLEFQTNPPMVPVPPGYIEVLDVPESEAMYWDVVNGGWYWNKEGLQQLARETRSAANSQPYVSGSIAFVYAQENWPYWYSTALREEPTAQRAVTFNLQDGFGVFTNAEIIGIFEGYWNFKQAIVEAFVTTMAEIEDGIITSKAEFLSAWDSIISGYADTRPKLPTVTELAGQIADLSAPKYATFPVFKSATVESGVATFHLTDDGLATGNALFSEVFQDSVQLIVNDATASYQMGWAFSNGGKTLTVTCNASTTADLVTGVIGQAPAPDGTAVKLTVWGL